MTLDLVCQVVDNYGDIAVSWRLAQALVQDGPGLSVRLLVDDLGAFHQLEPRLNPQAPVQTLGCPGGAVTVVSTTGPGALDESLPVADVLVEAFGAPTPEPWLDRFRRAAGSVPRVILHLEYLTAEPWSESYHGLPSPLGWTGVNRFFFVPGFRPHTGGLVFTDPQPRPAPRGSEDWFMTLFSYEHDYTRFWTQLADYLEVHQQTARVLVFEGLSRSGALESWDAVQKLRGPLPRITVVDQPFVDQDTYTALLLAGDFHVVRGEESWVQAVLAGKPFLWHAYLQPEGHQIVKAEAFLDVWRPWFEREGAEGLRVFETVASSLLAFNRRLVNSAAEAPQEDYLVFWENRALLERVGEAWAADLRKNAKLSRRMLEFLEKVRV